MPKLSYRKKENFWFTSTEREKDVKRNRKMLEEVGVREEIMLTVSAGPAVSPRKMVKLVQTFMQEHGRSDWIAVTNRGKAERAATSAHVLFTGPPTGIPKLADAWTARHGRKSAKRTHSNTGGKIAYVSRDLDRVYNGRYSAGDFFGPNWSGSY